MEIAGRRQVLALSGGGYRGLYTAKLISLIEKHTKRPFASHFDLIAGTSIGGILALALACEIPAEKVVDLFEKHGSKIFKRTAIGYRHARYSPKTLQGLLADREVFGERTLADCKHPVVIPSVNYSTGEPQMFKTPHAPQLMADQSKKLVDIALATSAAPTFFPRHVLDNNQYVDGGLVANAPGMIALHEAEFYLGVPARSIHVLSIGTMAVKPSVDPKASRLGGVRDWGDANFFKTWKIADLFKSLKMTERLLELTISANETLTDYMLGQRLGGDRYLRVDEHLSSAQATSVGLSETGPAALEVSLGRAAQRARRLLGSDEFQKWLSYQASPPKFYHTEAADKEHSNA